MYEGLGAIKIALGNLMIMQYACCTIAIVFNVLRELLRRGCWGRKETVKPTKLPFIDNDGVEFNG